MDTGRETLGHGEGIGTLGYGDWQKDTRTWTLVIEIEREQTTYSKLIDQQLNISNLICK